MQQLQDLKSNAQAGTTALAKTANHPIQGKVLLLDQKKELLGAGIPGHMLVEREIRSAVIALANSKDLQASTPASFYTAVSVAINSGIGLGRGMGYLVAYKGNCQYVPGWRGLTDLVTRSGRASVWTGVVHKGDDFDYALGDSPFLKHKPGDSEEFKDITHYYSVGRVKGSDYPVIEVWSANRVAKHLAKFNKVGTRHYALKDDNNMEHYGRKVVLLQVIKYLPQSQEIANALAAEAAHEAGKNAVIDGDMVWIDEQGGFDDGAGSSPLAAEIHEPQAQTQNQQASQQRPAGEVVDHETGEVAQTTAPAETEEEADFRRSQEKEAAKAATTAPTPTPAPAAAPTAAVSRTRRRTTGAPE